MSGRGAYLKDYFHECEPRGTAEMILKMLMLPGLLLGDQEAQVHTLPPENKQTKYRAQKFLK